MDNSMHCLIEPSSSFVGSTVEPFQSSLDVERLNALRDLALMLLSAVESLQIGRPAPAASDAGLPDQVQRFESDLIRQALHRTGGNQARAARLLGVKYTTLNAKIRRYKIPAIGQASEVEDQARDSEDLIQRQVFAA
jgi:DNA-binding NtrC family response regulator